MKRILLFATAVLFGVGAGWADVPVGCRQVDDLYLQMRNCTEVVSRAAKAAGSDRISAYLGRAGPYIHKFDNQRAIADFNKSIALAPRNANAYFYPGLSYQFKRDLAMAIADYRTAREFDPSDQKAENKPKALGVGP